jgi:GNAT superfamily N-acetyltransferase
VTVDEVETNPVDFADFAALHALLSTSFAYMAARIDPPSSMLQLTEGALRVKVEHEDLFLIRAAGRPIACLFGHARPACYYVGKLAVAAPQRRRGLARRLFDAAAVRARSLGLGVLELQSRIELAENHAAFAAMEFVEVGRTAHPGYDRPTSITMRRQV